VDKATAIATGYGVTISIRDRFYGLEKQRHRNVRQLHQTLKTRLCEAKILVNESRLAEDSASRQKCHFMSLEWKLRFDSARFNSVTWGS
jgi:hypothetical protein